MVPVYNQEAEVSFALGHLRSCLDALPLSYELIVVDDGSDDDTLAALQKEESVDSRIRVISYKPNRGKGYAVKKGVLESKGDVVMFIDGDLDVSPKLIGEYVGQLQENDLAIASKMHPLSVVKAPTSRRFLSRAFNLVVRLAVGIKVKDTQAGMKAGRGDALRKIFGMIVVKRYAFDVEVLAVASLLGLKIKELPVEITIDRKFKARDILKMFIDVLGIGYRLHIKRWYKHNINQIRKQ